MSISASPAKTTDEMIRGLDDMEGNERSNKKASMLSDFFDTLMMYRSK